MPSVVVLNGEDVGEWFSIQGTPLVFGREENLLAQIHDPAVSRQHMEIRLEATSRTYHAVDLGSRNGIHINGGPSVRRWQLKDGDVIQIGFTVLGFTFEDFAKDRHAKQCAKKMIRQHQVYLDEVAAKRDRRLSRQVDMTGLEDVGRRR